MLNSRRDGLAKLPEKSCLRIRALLGWHEPQLRWLAGDGSDRCYYRLFDAAAPERPSYVLMALPPSEAAELASGRYAWLEVGRDLAQHGIRVPAPLVSLEEAGGLVIEDLGDEMFEDRAGQMITAGTDTTALYAAGFELIGDFLAIPTAVDTLWTSRAFDSAKLADELRFFQRQFLERTPGCALSNKEERLFTAEAASLAAHLAERPRFFVHRDFHSRNIMVLGDGGLAVIDFQDARLGPAAYDVVSLCFDSYVPLPQAKRLEILASGCEHLVARGAGALAAEIRSTWQAMLLQRQLKAVGSFAYLSHAKKRGNYLRYVRPAWETLQLIDDPRWPFLRERIVGHYLAEHLGQSEEA